jgi:tripartite-type tricarboxylate transporter receptor subunit TctC
LTPTLGQALGQTVVVENRTGGNYVPLGEACVRANPDGYTLLATVNQTMVGSRFLFTKLPYDIDKAFEPITMMACIYKILTSSELSDPIHCSIDTAKQL